jgi:hypothetical protein
MVGMVVKLLGKKNEEGSRMTLQDATREMMKIGALRRRPNLRKPGVHLVEMCHYVFCC